MIHQQPLLLPPLSYCSPGFSLTLKCAMRCVTVLLVGMAWTTNFCWNQGFSIQQLFGVPSGLAVLIIGYYLLGLDLDNYLPFWIISFSTDAICMLFLLILLPESMPDSLRRSLDWWDLNPFRQYWSCAKVVFGYPLLIGELDKNYPSTPSPLRSCRCRCFAEPKSDVLPPVYRCYPMCLHLLVCSRWSCVGDIHTAVSGTSEVYAGRDDHSECGFAARCHPSKHRWCSAYTLSLVAFSLYQTCRSVVPSVRLEAEHYAVYPCLIIFCLGNAFTCIHMNRLSFLASGCGLRFSSPFGFLWPSSWHRRASQYTG
jgi:hypothetical protein